MLDRLIADGYTSCKNILPPAMLDELRAAADELWQGVSDEQRRQSGGQGSIMGMPYMPPIFTELIAHAPALAALKSLGFERPRYWSGYLIAKEPYSIPSYWHQDWPFWSNPVSADPVPHQLFLMYYLVDTTPENGCLRVLPGSHRRWFPQHDMGSHDDATRHEDPETSPAYAPSPDQVDLPVKAGDLLIGDARILHAPCANTTDQRRTVITMWYLPRFEELPEPMKAAFHGKLYDRLLDGVPPEYLAKLEPLRLNYTGDATPAEWDRNPGQYLQR